MTNILKYLIELHTYKRCCSWRRKYGLVDLMQSIKTLLPAVVGQPIFSANNRVKRKLLASVLTAQWFKAVPDEENAPWNKCLDKGDIICKCTEAAPVEWPCAFNQILMIIVTKTLCYQKRKQLDPFLPLVLFLSDHLQTLQYYLRSIEELELGPLSLHTWNFQYIWSFYKICTSNM